MPTNCFFHKSSGPLSNSVASIIFFTCKNNYNVLLKHPLTGSQSPRHGLQGLVHSSPCSTQTPPPTVWPWASYSFISCWIFATLIIFQGREHTVFLLPQDLCTSRFSWSHSPPRPLPWLFTVHPSAPSFPRDVFLNSLVKIRFLRHASHRQVLPGMFFGGRFYVHYRAY